MIVKVYKTCISEDLLLLRAMMSPMDSPFGPRARMAYTCRADAVAFVDKMGGPRVAMTNKYSQINEYVFSVFTFILSA